jgi:hypothetical protein
MLFASGLTGVSTPVTLVSLVAPGICSVRFMIGSSRYRPKLALTQIFQEQGELPGKDASPRMRRDCPLEALPRSKTFSESVVILTTLTA